MNCKNRSSSNADDNPMRLLLLLTFLTVLETQPGQAQAPEPSQSTEALQSPEPLQSTEQFVSPGDLAAKAFAPPPSGKPLTKSHLWVDRENRRIYADGYVAMREGPLEMFACPIGTKEHESIVATMAKSSELHAALLAVDATQGTPVRVIPQYLPATGQRIRVWVSYYDDQDRYQCRDAREMIVTNKNEPMDVDWVFAGSSTWTDPVDKQTYYQADGGDMICVSNFSTALMDVPIESSADANQLYYKPNTSQIPGRGTPVRLTLVPIPIPPAKEPDAETKPGPEILPRNTEISAPPSTKPISRPSPLPPASIKD